MKKIIFLTALLMPMLLNAQTDSGKKNKSIIIFLHPLQGQTDNFEKGLTHHNQTFHNGKDPIDVYQVLTGDQTGEYAFVYRNNYTWADVETASKAAADKDHAADWDQNVAKYSSTDASRNFYVNSNDSYLPDDITQFNTNLSVIYMIDIFQGKEDDFYAGVKKIKEMYKKNNSNNYFLIQTRVFGKGSQATVVIPLSEGWTSLEPNPNNDWPKMFKKAFPNEDFKTWLKKFEATQQQSNSFVVKLREDLSSPM